MSLVAKVFIVINQILSLALIFLMATLLVHKADYKKLSTLERRDWEAVVAERKAKEADYEVQVAGLGKKIKDTDNTHNDIVQEIDSVKDALKVAQDTEDVLKTEIAELERQLKTSKDVNRDAGARKSVLQRQISTAESKLGQAKEHENKWTKALQAEEAKVRTKRAELNSD